MQNELNNLSESIKEDLLNEFKVDRKLYEDLENNIKSWELGEDSHFQSTLSDMYSGKEFLRNITRRINNINNKLKPISLEGLVVPNINISEALLNISKYKLMEVQFKHNFIENYIGTKQTWTPKDIKSLTSKMKKMPATEISAINEFASYLTSKKGLNLDNKSEIDRNDLVNYYQDFLNINYPLYFARSVEMTDYAIVQHTMNT